MSEAKIMDGVVIRDDLTVYVMQHGEVLVSTIKKCTSNEEAVQYAWDMGMEFFGSLEDRFHGKEN